MIYKVYRTPASVVENPDFLGEEWQRALDVWSYWKTNGYNPIIECYTEGKVPVMHMEDESSIKEWSEYLMTNRVEKRLINEINSETEKSFEELMFGNTHFKSKKGFDEYGIYGENNPPVNAVPSTAFTETPDVVFEIVDDKIESAVVGELPQIKIEKIYSDDPVINPKHYKMIPKEAYQKYPEGLEYMDLMEYILKHHEGVEGHLLGQIFKYACRLGRKDSIVQDAKKIEWYANRLVKVLEDA